MDTVHECDRETDGRTDGQTDRRTDRITITKTVQRRASHGKNCTLLSSGTRNRDVIILLVSTGSDFGKCLFSELACVQLSKYLVSKS